MNHKTFRRYIIFSYIFLVYSGFLLAQNPRMEEVGKTFGLRGKSIYHVFQDSRKQLWFATEFGVSRFDGRSFTELDQTAGMPEIAVLRISEDSNGNLWFSTLSGIAFRYDGRSVQTSWGEKFDAEMKGANYVSTILGLPNGDVVYGTQDGRVVEISSSGQARVLFKSQWGAIQLIDFREDKSLEFHFSSVQNLGIWKDERLEILSFEQLLDGWRFGTLRCVKIGLDRFLYAVNNRLALVERDRKGLRKVKEFSVDANQINFVGVDNTGDFWIGTTRGAVQFRKEDKNLTSPRYFLNGNYIYSVCRDHEGGLWFTGESEIYHCRFEEVGISLPTQSNIAKEATAIHFTSKGVLFVGFIDGTVEQVDRSNFSKNIIFPNLALNPAPKVEKILDGPHNSVLAAGGGGLMLIENGKSYLLSHYKISDIASYGEELGICLFSNWCKISIQSGERWDGLFEDTIRSAQSKRTNRCLHCCYDSTGNFWVASFEDLIGEMPASLATKIQSQIGVNRLTNSILKTLDRRTYAYGTTNQGLYLLHDRRLIRFSKADGLLDNRVEQVESGTDGFLWILTSKGLSKASIEGGNASIVSTHYLHSLFGTNNVSDIKVHNDTIWAATDFGLAYIPTAVLNRPRLNPTVRLIGIWANNQARVTGSEPSVSLRYDENYIRVRYLANSLLEPNEIEYRYRINGGDYQTTSSEIIELPALSFGNYLIEVTCRQIGGSWKGDALQIRFDIHPPFWKTVWFAVVVIGSIFGLAILAIKLFLANAKRRSLLRESLALARQNALISQMNPHFIFNALNSIQNFILNHETEVANGYLADFSALMRSVLVSGRSAYISLAEEIKLLNLYLKLEALRLDDRFDFSFTISPGIIASQMKIPTLMLQPLLENAIWHGLAPLFDRKGVLNVKFEIRDQHLVCTVIDNGIGRKLAAERALKFGKKHQSLATKIMQERVDLLGELYGQKIWLEINDLYDAQHVGVGTQATLFLPIDVSQRK